MEADGVPSPPPSVTALYYGYLKLKATQIIGKSEQMLGSSSVELGISCTEGSALSNCAACFCFYSAHSKKGFISSMRILSFLLIIAGVLPVVE